MTTKKSRKDFPVIARKQEGHWELKRSIVTRDVPSIDDWFALGYNMVDSIEDLVRKDKKSASSFLHGKGLPTSNVVYHRGKKWFKSEPSKKHPYSVSSLIIFITESCGYEPDSLEQLAGLVIHHCSLVEQHLLQNRDKADSLSLLADVYWLGSYFERFVTFRKKFRDVQKSRVTTKTQWRDLLIEYLATADPDSSGTKLFDSISGDMLESEISTDDYDLSVYRDESGRTVHISVDGIEVYSCSRDTFRKAVTRYKNPK